MRCSFVERYEDARTRIPNSSGQSSRKGQLPSFLFLLRRWDVRIPFSVWYRTSKSSCTTSSVCNSWPRSTASEYGTVTKGDTWTVLVAAPRHEQHEWSFHVFVVIVRCGRGTWPVFVEGGLLGIVAARYCFRCKGQIVLVTDRPCRVC